MRFPIRRSPLVANSLTFVFVFTAGIINFSASFFIPYILFYSSSIDSASSASTITIFGKNIIFFLRLIAVFNCLSMLFFLVRSRRLGDKVIRLVRRLLYGVLSVITLCFFVMIGFLSFPCNDKLVVNDKALILLTVALLIIGMICCYVIYYIEQCFCCSKLPSFENLVVNREELSDKRHKIIEFCRTTIILFLVSLLPFLIDRCLDIILAGTPIPIGHIAGINDFYLIPAACGAGEAYLGITSNEVLDTPNRRLRKRALISIVWALTFISFALFAFGCNKCAYGVLDESNVLLLSAILSFLIIFFTGCAKQLEVSYSANI